MLKMVDGTGIIGVDMVCPLGVSAPQPPNYDRVELEGTGMLVLPNSLDAPLERLELGGKTEQVQTSGKNLFDIKTYREMNGCEIINNNQLSFVQNLAKITYEIKLDSGDYRISFKRKKYSSFTIRNGESVLHANGGEIDYGYNIKLSEPAVISVEFASGQNPNAEQRYVYDIQLEKGTTATPHEPYTGGKPSPSPEYPQEIKSVGRLNEDTGKYEVEISISGRNLFDFSTCEEGKVFEGSGNIIAANGVLTDFIPCFPNSQYSRSRTGSTIVAFYDCDKNKIGFEIVGNTTFVTPEKCRYFRFSAVKTIVDYTKIVASPGQTVMDYEPYREPKFFILTLNKPLRGIGEMKDELSESGILRRVKSITLNGSEKWYKYENSAFVAMNCYGLKIDDLEVKNYNLTTLCNYLKWAKFPQDVESQSAHGGYIYFTVPKETCLDLESFKEWLAKNTPVLEYRLKEPVLEELSEEDKASIRALKTYYPTTVITADGGELDPDIKVTYRKEI